MPDFTTRPILLKADQFKIAGQIYVPEGGGRSKYPAVCICHGIPAGVADPADRGYPLLAERVCQEGLATFIFNFRGTGVSEGNLDLLGWARDLTAAIDYLCTLSEVDGSKLSLLGFSGGAAVSVYVASQDKRISAVAACACPAEFSMFADPALIIQHFRAIGVIRDKDFPDSIEEWINGFRLVSPINYVAGIAPRPLLLVHGNRDPVINVSHAYRLYEKAGEPKKLIIIDGADHRLRLDARAMAAAIDWLKSLS